MDPLWRKMARRVRRYLYSYLAAEVVGTVQHQLAQLRAELAAERDAASKEHVDHRGDLNHRLTELEILSRGLREEFSGDREAVREHLAGFDALTKALGQQLVRQEDTSSQRMAKLEMLALEHPDVLAVSRQGHPFTTPAVSVIMPTWNRSAVVGAAIRSVQAQRFSDWELIVVDDGSTDDTAEIMTAFAQDSRIRYAVRAHSGQCAARNHALRLARGTLIAYLDSDNVWYPGYLAAAVAAFATNPAIDCLYGAMITDVHRPGELILFDPFDRERLLAANFIGMSTFVHRRDLVDRLGGFDEELNALEDWDLILRYTEHAPAYRLPALAVRYRVTDDKRVSQVARMEAADARIRGKWRNA